MTSPRRFFSSAGTSLLPLRAQATSPAKSTMAVRSRTSSLAFSRSFSGKIFLYCKDQRRSRRARGRFERPGKEARTPPPETPTVHFHGSSPDSGAKLGNSEDILQQKSQHGRGSILACRNSMSGRAKWGSRFFARTGVRSYCVAMMILAQTKDF